jgi:hypothetical protein
VPPAAALEAAEQVAWQLASNGGTETDWRILVTNEAGEKVAEEQPNGTGRLIRAKSVRPL